MVEIDLQSLGVEPVPVRGTLPESGELWRGAEVEFAGAPAYDLRAAFTGERDVHVRGGARARFRVECRRCLRELEKGVEVELDLLFDPEVIPDTGDEQVYPLEAEGGVLDLAPALREQLLLAAPRYPLCREGCEGLCPSCGVDRNERSCDCVLREPDPRWDALRELRSGGVES